MRYDLPFRQDRPHGPPRPTDAARDREGLRDEIYKIRAKNPDQVWLGGQSYGGRQASMLAAETPGLADRLLLLSYPLHPPGKPTQLRTAHFPNCKHRRYSFMDREIRSDLLTNYKRAGPDSSARQLLEIKGAGHNLGSAAAAAGIAAAFLPDFNRQQHQSDPK